MFFEYGVTLSPLAWCAAAMATLLTAIAKSGFGGGAIGPLATPIFMLVAPPSLVIAILLPLYLCADVFAVAHWRRERSSPLLSLMVLGGVIGTIFGWLLFAYISEALIKIIVGCLAAYTALRWLSRRAGRQKSQGNNDKNRQGAPPFAPSLIARALSWCGLSGFTSAVALAGGPPVLAFLLPLNLPRTTVVTTLCRYYLAINSAKIPFFIALGLITTQTLLSTALLLPLIPIGAAIGKKIHNLISDRAFYAISYISLLMIGIKLIADGWKTA